VSKRPIDPPCNLTVYDGQMLLGEILEHRGMFVAIDLDGKRLGTFADMRSAARALPNIEDRQ